MGFTTTLKLSAGKNVAAVEPYLTMPAKMLVLGTEA